MAHPFQQHRQTKVEHERVGHIAKGYASGGAVHDDAKEDRAMVKSMVKPKALRASGGKVKARADRPHRAKGGRVKHKAHTNVNVIVGHGSQPPAAPSPMIAAGAPPVMPRPPVPTGAGPALPPPAAPAAPAAPSALPPGIRRDGGRAYKAGGAVKSGEGWTESMGDRKPFVKHDAEKPLTNEVGKRGKPITYKTGGAVEGPRKGGMGPKFSGGAGGGEARLEKAHKAARK